MKSNEHAPILEFDPSPSAILNPHSTTIEGVIPEQNETPQKAVFCFFLEVLNKLAAENHLVQVGKLISEMGDNPIYKLEQNGQTILVMHPGVGAPLAAGFQDELIALGVKKFIACGGCGVLVNDFHAGEAMIVTSAVRDEGTSYHYLAPSREIMAQEGPVKVLEEVFKSKGLEYRMGKTWTTDAIYRETEKKRDLRLEEGCLTVEMEASAFMAVARFRGVEFGQVLYGGDLVVPEGWDARGWNGRLSIRENLFWLAVEACQKM